MHPEEPLCLDHKSEWSGSYHTFPLSIPSPTKAHIPPRHRFIQTKWPVSHHSTLGKAMVCHGKIRRHFKSPLDPPPPPPPPPPQLSNGSTVCLVAANFFHSKLCWTCSSHVDVKLIEIENKSLYNCTKYN